MMAFIIPFPKLGILRNKAKKDESEKDNHSVTSTENWDGHPALQVYSCRFFSCAQQPTA